MIGTVKEVRGSFRLVATKREIEKLRVKFQGDYVTSNGIVFDYELSGPDGADFTLFPEKHHVEEDIQKAKAELRYQHDVTGFQIGLIEGETDGDS